MSMAARTPLSISKLELSSKYASFAGFKGASLKIPIGVQRTADKQKAAVHLVADHGASLRPWDQ